MGALGCATGGFWGAAGSWGAGGSCSAAGLWCAGTIWLSLASATAGAILFLSSAKICSLTLCLCWTDTACSDGVLPRVEGMGVTSPRVSILFINWVYVRGFSSTGISTQSPNSDCIFMNNSLTLSAAADTEGTLEPLNSIPFNSKRLTRRE